MSLAFRTFVLLEQKARGRSRGPRPPPREIGRGGMPIAPRMPFRASHRGGSSDLIGAANFGRPRTWSRRRGRIPRDWPQTFRRR